MAMPNRAVLAAVLLSIAAPARFPPSGGQAPLQKPAQDTVLKAADIPPRLFPETVFFRGQTAPVQMRNTAGVHFADDRYVLAGVVDSSGYSSAIREKYQAYLLTEVDLRIAAEALKPGAYGMGFLEGGKFVILDLAAQDLLQAASTRDPDIKRPVPLQILAGPRSGTYRLYMGRDFVEVARAK